MMQKTNLSNLGTAYLVNVETGEKVPWDGIAEYSDDLEEEQQSIVNDLRDAIIENLYDDKTPNPIYIPKHVKHRKKGRR